MNNENDYDDEDCPSTVPEFRAGRVILQPLSETEISEKVIDEHDRLHMPNGGWLDG
jgi:hypothetical protein